MKKNRVNSAMFDGRIGIEKSTAISNILHDALLEEIHKDRGDRKMTSVHAGKIAECDRKTAFLLYNLKEDYADPVGMIHMKMGIQWHEFLQGLLVSTGKAKSVEQKMPRLGEIVGMMDVLVNDETRSVPVEIKPMSKDKFQRATEPDRTHVGQLQLYMHWTNSPYGYLVYYCKNITHYRFDTYKRLPFLEFKIQYNKALVEEFIEKSTRIMKAVEKRTLPPIPKEFGPEFCKYCFVYPTKCLLGMKHVEQRERQLAKLSSRASITNGPGQSKKRKKGE